MLTQIRNALAVKKQEVVVRHSALKKSLADLLLAQGWLSKAEIVEEESKAKFLKLTLQYAGDEPAISGLKRVSKPGQRIYAKVADIPRMSSGLGAIIISTSKGLMTDKQARKEKMGGEVICQIW